MELAVSTVRFLFSGKVTARLTFTACLEQSTFYESVDLSLEAQFIFTQNIARLVAQLN